MLQQLSRVILRGAVVCLFVAYLPCSVMADTISGPKGDKRPEETVVGRVEGPLDGLDLKTRHIWISDTVYILDRTVRVKGTTKKLGLITDLKSGEVIKATLRRNEDQPAIPIVTLIERQ